MNNHTQEALSAQKQAMWQHQNQGGAGAAGCMGYAASGMGRAENYAGGLPGTIGMLEKLNPEIPDKLGQCFGRTEELSEKIARLGIRLASVVAPRPAGDTKACTAPTSSIMGDSLAQLVARLELMIDAVDSLTEQLEL